MAEDLGLEVESQTVESEMVESQTQTVGPFHRDYFEWPEQELSRRFVEQVSAGRLKQNESFVDLKIKQRKSLTKRVHDVYKDTVNLPSLLKLLPGLPPDPTPVDYMRSVATS